MTLVRILELHSEVLGPGFDLDIDIGTGLGGGAFGTFLTTLVVAAILVAVVPEYTESTMAAVISEPIDCLLYGILALVGLICVLFLLAITLVGLLVVIPLVIGATLVGAIGAAIAFLGIADRLLAEEDGWVKRSLLAAGLNGALALTGIGVFVGFAVGAAGVGAVLRAYLGG